MVNSNPYKYTTASFQQMAAAYPQVLIAQRNQYQLEVEYVESLTRAAILAARIEGLLLTSDGLSAPDALHEGSWDARDSNDISVTLQD